MLREILHTMNDLNLETDEFVEDNAISIEFGVNFTTKLLKSCFIKRLTLWC